MAKVKTTETGVILGFYEDDFAPDDAIEISDAVHAELFNGYPNKGYLNGEVIDIDYSATLSLERVKANKYLEIESAYEAAVSKIKSGTPTSEIETWVKQEHEARSYLSNPLTASTPLIDGLVAARGIDKDELVSKIIAKADTWATAIGKLTGTRQKYEKQYLAATTTEDYVAIKVEF